LTARGWSGKNTPVIENLKTKPTLNMRNHTHNSSKGIVLSSQVSSVTRNRNSPTLIGIVLIAVALLTTSCMPPLQYIVPPLFLFATIVAILILGVSLIAFGAHRPALKAEGLYLLTLDLLYLVGYLVPLTAWTLGVEGSAAAYTNSLIIAALSALIIAAAAWLFRKNDPAFLKPGYAMLFGFLLFFLINFGFYISVSQFANYSDAQISGLEGIVFYDRIWGQIPYLSFLLAPAGVIIAWFIDTNFNNKQWPSDKLVRVNLWALWAVQVALIMIVVLIRAQKIAAPVLGIRLDMSSADAAQLKTYYLMASDFRADLFFVSAHDMLVVVALTVGVIAMNAKERLSKLKNRIALAGAVLAVLLAFLPFYIGQKASLEHFIGPPEGTYVERDARRNEFVAARGLYPNSTTLKHLLISLTAGGVLAFSFNLPGVKISLG
jgi:hypothetical protein